LLRDLHRARTALSQHAAAQRLRQFAQLGQHFFAIRGIGNAHTDTAALDADAALERDALFAQHAAHIVAQDIDLRAQNGARIDLQQHMRTALQIQAQHDGLMQAR
jgi:hypothetical protein